MDHKNKNISGSNMLVYVEETSARLEYILDFVFTQVLLCKHEITTDKKEFETSENPKLNFSKTTFQNAFQIIPHSILFEENIQPLEINCFDWHRQKAFFKTSEEQIPFDIFGASFYLISRYEEYLTTDKDEFGRFPHQNSTAFKNEFLHLPLVDIWLQEFQKIIRRRFPEMLFGKKHFKFTPTYDIDIAYSYKHKSLLRNLGGGFADILKGNFSALRLKVLRGLEKDPYDCYDFLDQLHEENNLKPIYFFLLGRGGEFDKNLSPQNEGFKRLIQHIADKYEVGIHPSYRSNDDENELNIEIQTLANIADKQMNRSRQHFIKYSLPTSYNILINHKIIQEYSMGYGSINGFRASTSNPFCWFNLDSNQATQLLIHPFCFMECNSFFEQKQSIEQTTKEIEHYIEIVKKVNGILITIWHNFSLGTDELWTGWKELYIDMIKKIQ